MHIFTAGIRLVPTVVVLLLMAAFFSTSRLEYCGQPDTLRPQNGVAHEAPSTEPTLAPPQKMVFLRVESDKPDIEIGWIDN